MRGGKHGWRIRLPALNQGIKETSSALCVRVIYGADHIRALKDLRKKGRADKPEWVKWMAARQRKTLVVCRTCHDDIHGGRLQRHTSGE